MNNDLEFHRRLGRVVQHRRIAQGLSQEVLAKHIGVAFQQQGKYERGVNRIPVCNLIKIAQLCGCTVSEFIADAGAPECPAAAPTRKLLLMTSNALSGLSRKHLQAVRRFIRSLAKEAG